MVCNLTSAVYESIHMTREVLNERKVWTETNSKYKAYDVMAYIFLKHKIRLTTSLILCFRKMQGLINLILVLSRILTR